MRQRDSKGRFIKKPAFRYYILKEPAGKRDFMRAMMLVTIGVLVGVALEMTIEILNL